MAVAMMRGKSSPCEHVLEKNNSLAYKVDLENILFCHMVKIAIKRNRSMLSLKYSDCIFNFTFLSGLTKIQGRRLHWALCAVHPLIKNGR